MTTSPHPADRALLGLAEGQLGLVSTRQALGAGLTRGAWDHRRSTGDWTPLTSRVARRAGAPPSDAQAALAAILDMGGSGFLSHQSAAALWGVPGFRLRPLQVIVPRGHRTASRLATVHHPRHLPDPFATTIDDVPVVRPALLLLELAPLVHPARLHRLLDWFWARRYLSGPSVRGELSSLMHRGRAGTAPLRELLDGLPEDYVPPASNLEARFAQIVADHDLPPMRRQVDLGDDERWSGRVDFVAVDLPLVVEVDSDLHHTALTHVAADEARRRRLESAGFCVIQIPEFEIWHRPEEVADRVRRAVWALRVARAAA